MISACVRLLGALGIRIFTIEGLMGRLGFSSSRFGEGQKCGGLFISALGLGGFFLFDKRIAFVISNTSESFERESLFPKSSSEFSRKEFV